MNSTPKFQGVPFLCTFEGGASDAVILAYKVVDTRVYAYGVTVDKVIAFKPPKDNPRTSEIDEAQIFSSYKLPHNIISVKKLENTETHKLRDMVDNMIAAALAPLAAGAHRARRAPACVRVPPCCAHTRAQVAIMVMVININKAQRLNKSAMVQYM